MSQTRIRTNPVKKLSKDIRALNRFAKLITTDESFEDYLRKVNSYPAELRHEVYKLVAPMLSFPPKAFSLMKFEADA